ncbi:MAG: hypothetical protein LBC62_04060 [Treponema sp.]|jgi:hypothetical protein|nr:hypothetical protein [Treponema sp.]
MARELGALMIFLYLNSTPSFGKTAAVLQLEGNIHLNKNAVYERVVKSVE